MLLHFALNRLLLTYGRDVKLFGCLEATCHLGGLAGGDAIAGG